MRTTALSLFFFFSVNILLIAQGQYDKSNVKPYVKYFELSDARASYARFMDFHWSSLADKDKWTLIDLVQIKSAYDIGKLSLSEDQSLHSILSDLHNFDYLIIPLLDRRSRSLTDALNE